MAAPRRLLPCRSRGVRVVSRHGRDHIGVDGNYSVAAGDQTLLGLWRLRRARIENFLADKISIRSSCGEPGRFAPQSMRNRIGLHQKEG